MKKNIIFLLVDSVYYKHILATDYKNTPMPFLNDLMKKSVYTEKMYSQAPFTEAATLPILSGRNVLDYGGYMKRFKYRKTMTERFHDQGYETFINHYYPSIYPSQTYREVDKQYYVDFFNFSHIDEYRLAYYRPLYVAGKLNNIELSLLNEFMEDNLKAWILLIEQLIAHDESTDLLWAYGNTDELEKELEVLSKEYKLFLKDQDAYMKNFFMYPNHILKNIKTRTLNRKVNDSFKKSVQERYYSIFEQIYKINKNRNVRNLRFPLKRFLVSCVHGDKHNAYQYVAMYKNALQDSDLMNRISEQYDMFKPMISMRNYIDHGLNYIEKRSDDKPFFVYFHVDDAHSPENFFSSDSTDLKVLDQEFKNIKKYLADLPKNYHGALSADLSLLYVDGCIQHLFARLKELKKLEDTVVVITADHGFSYSYDPIRTNYVNNIHDENYNIPFIIYDQGRSAEIKTRYYESKDIIPTLMEVCGLKIDKDLSGMSVLSSDGRDYAIQEYMGGGCPDMERRPMLITIRNDRYVVSIELNVHEDFEEHRLTFVYDKKKDPQEFNNLNKKIDKKLIEEELGLLRNRVKEIQQDYKENENAFH